MTQKLSDSLCLSDYEYFLTQLKYGKLYVGQNRKLTLSYSQLNKSACGKLFESLVALVEGEFTFLFCTICGLTISSSNLVVLSIKNWILAMS